MKAEEATRAPVVEAGQGSGARVDPLLQTPIHLTGGEFEALVAFVRDALRDERATKQHLRPLVPASVPSGYPPMDLEECR